MWKSFTETALLIYEFWSNRIGQNVITLLFWNETWQMGITSMFHWKETNKWQTWETLQWRKNELDCVSNHQRHDCLPNRLSRRESKKTSKLRVTGLCEGNSPVNSPHKGAVTRKCFHLMMSSQLIHQCGNFCRFNFKHYMNRSYLWHQPHLVCVCDDDKWQYQVTCRLLSHKQHWQIRIHLEIPTDRIKA